ncbi:MOSC domain-containing protein [Shewanella sp. CG12_big_fil_rev_8_21_14_0_65_47_15]|uniref:MOSC domain-containing protein n=1 Tax=Shewanella sp. CG12_big_fil_rev_8_21_14_0_65_47_15 TaxID=1975537 RepID=UPI0025E282D2|nr:MOSC domain-containing protein [Shewanella sp. CG12_big_fil_rev_8_21_14_0_65_47_15]
MLLVNKLSGLYSGSNIQEIEGISTGINGKQATEQLIVHLDHVEGDTQADPKHHGGLDRVLHHFPREHYGQYRRWDLITRFEDAPCMGENISTVGLNETQVNIGDVLQIGQVTVQVTQPRSPCFKLNLQFGHRDFALAMQQSQLCGWFYRVLTPGVIQLQDKIELLERRTDICVAEAMSLYFSSHFDASAYDRLASCEGLAQSWVNSLQRRLTTQRVEDWQMRLYGPSGK